MALLIGNVLDEHENIIDSEIVKHKDRSEANNSISVEIEKKFFHCLLGVAESITN